MPEVTNNELERLRGSIDKLTDAMQRLEERMAETYVRKDVYLEARKADADAGLALTEKVNRLASVIDWGAKIIVGAVILALLSLVIYSNKGLPR